jgi:hypothetical protein
VCAPEGIFGMFCTRNLTVPLAGTKVGCMQPTRGLPSHTWHSSVLVGMSP